MSSSGTLYKCDVCGWQPERTTDIHNCKAVPKDKLRELVERWRTYRPGSIQYASGLADCADELESIYKEK